MPKAQRNIVDSDKTHWFEKAWGKAVTICGGIVGLITIGYSIGSYTAGNKAEIEKIKLQQDCNERVHQIENDYRNMQLSEDKKLINDLQEAVKSYPSRAK